MGFTKWGAKGPEFFFAQKTMKRQRNWMGHLPDISNPVFIRICSVQSISSSKPITLIRKYCLKRFLQTVISTSFNASMRSSKSL